MGYLFLGIYERLIFKYVFDISSRRILKNVFACRGGFWKVI